MNRRELLRGLLAGAGVAAAGELIVPSRSIFLPPRGGWRPWENKFQNLTHFGGLPYLPRSYDFRVNQQYTILEPGDLVVLDMPDARQFVCVTSVGMREDGTVDVSGMEEVGISGRGCAQNFLPLYDLGDMIRFSRREYKL